MQSFTYIHITIAYKASSKEASNAELYNECLICKDIHFDGAITRALMEKRFEDARKLKLQKAQTGYEISEVVTDELRPRLENLLALLSSRFEKLATAGEIDDCEICSNHLDMIAKILNGKTVSVILL